MSRIHRIVFFLIFSFSLLLRENAFCFWYGEHKFLGDQAFTKAITNDPNRASLWNKLVAINSNQHQSAVLNLPNQSLQIITYGDLTAASGEYEKEFKQVFYMLVRQYPQLWTSWDPKSIQKAKSDSSLIEKIKHHYKVEHISLNKQDAYNDVNVIFSDGSHFSMESITHFADFGSSHTITDELSSAVLRFVVIPEGRMNSMLEYQMARQIFYRGASINSPDWKLNISQIDSFLNSLVSENIASKYCVLHTLALQFADLAGSEYSKNLISDKCKLLMQLSFIFNSYADHFLQDAFSSGHLVIKSKDLKTFNGKGAHDYYNKEGIQVDNVDVSPWIAYGDGYLDTNQINYQKILQASINSINDVWMRFAQHTRYPSSVTMLEELHDKSEKQILAMFMRQYSAMRVMPLPIEQGQVEFNSSRNGLYVGTAVSIPKLFKSNLFPDVDFYGGFGKNFWYGKNSRMKHKESNLWLGCSIGYGWFSPTNKSIPIGVARISLFESVWFNSIVIDPFSFRFVQQENAVIDTKYSNNFMARNHLFSIWNPSFGYEFKSIESKLSVSVRLNYLDLLRGDQKNWYPSIHLRRYL